MAKYKVTGYVSVQVDIVLEANSKEEAKEKACDEMAGGLTSYCGNGGINKLVGVYGEEYSISPNDDYKVESIKEV
jgi:hypothetical protein